MRSLPDMRRAVHVMAAHGHVRKCVGRILAAAGHTVVIDTDLGDQTQPDGVLIDLESVPLDRIPLISQRWPGVPILVVARSGDLRSAAQALIRGADDVVHQPLRPATLLSAIARMACRGDEAQVIRYQDGADDTALVGTSVAMQTLRRDIAQAAAGEHATLIVGPPGAGRSLAAWLVHAHASRRGNVFAVRDARILPIEAITGACPMAGLAGGTLVLDGVQCLSEQALARIRAGIPEMVRTILIADLPADGRLEPAWSDRWGIRHVIGIQPLYRHGDDVVPIAVHRLRRLAARTRRDLTLTVAAIHALRAHHWPGNIQELVGCLASAVAVVAADGQILPQHLPLRSSSCADYAAGCLDELAAAALSDPPGGVYRRWLDRMDAVLLGRALHHFGGNVLRTASHLGINRATVRKRAAALRLLDDGADTPVEGTAAPDPAD